MKSICRGYKIKEKNGFPKKDDKNVTIDEEEVTACPDGTPPDEMEEGVSEKKDDKNEKFNEEKDAKCPDVISPDDMEKGVGDERDDNTERLDE